MAIIYTAKAIHPKDNTKFVYIGKTDRTLEDRRKEHEKAAFLNNPNSFHQAMRKIAIDDWIFVAELICDESEAIIKEKELIDRYREVAANDPNLIVLNDTSGKDTTKKKVSSKIDYGIPKANKQKNYAPSEMGKKFARESGKLKPVINLKTKRVYDSIAAAERNDSVPKSTIKNSCITGKKLHDDTRYAYLDLDDNPIFNEGHKQDRYIGKNARKIKELISGITYNSAKEVAQKYELSASSVEGFASGKYLIAKGLYVFCYLDIHDNEIKTSRHAKALEQINKKTLINYVAWPVELTFEVAQEQNQVAYFKSIDEVYKNLNIKNKGHIKAVCEGKRSHVEMQRIAFYNNETNSPILTQAHCVASKKIVRKIKCLTDGNIYNNCTEAGYKYSVDAGGIGLCARGILKSVRVRNKETNQTHRLRFAYLDKSNNPILTPKHKEPLLQRKGVPKIVLINQDPEFIKTIGTHTFSSLAEYCRKTGVPAKRARKYLKNKKINLLGYEFIEIV